MACVNPRPKTGGFSLVELALVMTVIGTILGGVWIVGGIAWDYSKRQQMVQDVGTTVTNIRNFYVGQGGIPALTLDKMSSTLITNNLIPADLVRSGTAATNGCANPNGLCADTVWGSTYDTTNVVDPNGTFRVCSWTLGSVVPTGNPNSPFAAFGGCDSVTPTNVAQTFGIAIRGLRIRDCIAMASALSGPGGPPGLVEVNINGENLLQTAGVPIHPISVSDATTWCASGVTDGAAILRPIYSIRTTAP